MSTSKHIDRICILAVVAALLISLLFVNGAAFGIQAQAKTMGYEARLFDTSRVHTIDIVIDDWDAFLQTARSEEYSACSVVIDGEAFHNVGIRGKGNTSLSTVSSLDSDRYSFKLEFDQYDATKTYYGLDKLSLNNLIQDNTMMKDYLVYQMMNEFGVAAPLCGYAYITVNGEDWGLYLAAEAVEESFLQRNYGSDYGQLYKPDSMDMGGGRGNGKDFDFESFMGASGDGASGERVVPSAPNGMQGGQRMPGMNADASQMPALPEDFAPTQMGGKRPNGNMGGGMGMGSGDSKLQYIDDQVSSYATIFENAKTDVTPADQQRLIASLKALSEGTDLPDVLFVEDVIRYFVVHNYVVNGDSYTGSMIHNYYLYEEDGQLSMIPWDYNLAFGTFQGNQASGAVNDDIDAPLSVTGRDRPMIDWIFDSEEYTRLYHQYFQEFLDTVDAQSIIAKAKTLISPYVEKDPTKFCTYEEFETGVETLRTFCDLRSQSVARQLAGETGAVDASGITLSDMGTMNHGMGGGNRQMPGQGRTQQKPGQAESVDGTATADETNRGNQRFPGFSGQGGMEIPEGMEDITEDSQAPFPNMGENNAGTAQGSGQWILLAVTVAILVGGLLFAFKFKR